MDKFLNEKVSDVQWIRESYKFVQSGGFPLTNSIMRELGMGQQVVAYHFTSQTKAPQLIALQGTKKTISAMTKIPRDLLKMPLGGVWKGGVLYRLTGNLMLASGDDVNSSPDQRGRRWIFFRKLGVGSYSQELLSDMLADKFEELVKQSGLEREFRAIRDKLDSTNTPLTSKVLATLISKYFDLALKFAKDNKKQLTRLLSGGRSSLLKTKITPGLDSWNELLLNNIKLEKVIFLDSLNYSPAFNTRQGAPSTIQPLPQSLRNRIINSVGNGDAMAITITNGKVNPAEVKLAIDFIIDK